MNFVKFVLIFSCLILCSCINNGRHNDTYRGYEEQPYQPYAAPVAVQVQQPVYTASVVQQPVYAEPVAAPQPAYAEPAPQPEVAANPYALEPPAYEKTINLALTQKEEELFQKEKYLMDAQQELYEREKKLADREAAFIGRSKALDYKEKNIEKGRYYAPIGPLDRAPARPAVAPLPPAPPALAPARVRRVEPPVQYENYQQQSYAAPAQTEYEEEESYVDLNGFSDPVANDDAQSGYIILQHPIQRDLVRCPVTDDVCLESYERMGYVRAANLSRFTAQDELDIGGSYPAGVNGQWRENNNIPRW